MSMEKLVNRNPMKKIAVVVESVNLLAWSHLELGFFLPKLGFDKSTYQKYS